MRRGRKKNNGQIGKHGFTRGLTRLEGDGQTDRSTDIASCRVSSSQLNGRLCIKL